MNESLPPQLADRLAEASRQRVFVPREVDEAILAAAQQHLAPVRQRHRWRRVAGWSSAVAAAVVVGVSAWLAMIGLQGRPSPTAAPHVAVRLPADIDGNGNVNVLDAFALARELNAAGNRPPTNGDVNGDGRIDQADVDAIAQRAVQLNGGQG